MRQGEEKRASPTDPADPIRSFYDSHPYPPPLADLSRLRDRYRDPHRRRVLSLLLWPLEKERPQRKILVAGCGTSQAAKYALADPDARVTAIDVSETSLRLTRQLKEKHGLANLELHHLAIERVGELGEAFDQIVCTGVLHHLSDPDAGLQSLRAALAPDGAMHVMVYAAYGRAGVYMMQDYARLLGLGTDEAELRDLARTIGALSSDHPIAGVAKRAKDFLNPDALADALINPRDRAFTVPELHDWLARCGLAFGRWREQAPYLPQCGIMARTPHAARLGLLPPPAQHAAMELLRGTMDRHAFVAYRDDRLAESQPITFAGDAWRSYVPVGLPWSGLARERAPKGASAVLINPNHIYPDLALPLEPRQERLLAGIDGKRSIDEILVGAGGAVREVDARAFFRRLWEHDQIVFDAQR
jgi:SAM-dependent methyltransferase